MKRTLVLGGGGVTGIAWHLGLLCGLQRAGVPLGNAGTIIGTSAGSVVGTLVAAGVDLEKAVALQETPADAATPSSPQATSVAAPPSPRAAGPAGDRWLTAMAVLADPSVPTMEARTRVGAMALAAAGDEAAYLERMRPLIPVADWPAADLRITVVDTADGRDRVLDAGSGATLLQAVAASCAVPGLMPPVTIGGRRYMDGGVRLGAAADLAEGADRLVVIAPLAMLDRKRIRDEMAASGAGRSLLIEPDAAALEAFGPDLMDARRRPAAVRAGLRQAGVLADDVREIWS
ncbi:patatin-like phospholipase family protein [Actinoplanes couchii]|uniref:Patatin n=1 Tax=Actinoplanes couchii TaxID=403638 RepID=A0ABQ3XKE7_9ACTN|nr:patatin-like phospholipase family protein [Actinoplanes couchii]MDR6320571.1 NTE family protein [Actinoplanes couchii]GID58974.1 patatin [Actinoplanes couchii]